MFFHALLSLVSWGLFVSVSGSPAVEATYWAIVSAVSPGQHRLTADSLRTVFNTLEKRVQCGEVSCEKCDLTDAIDQLISDHSVYIDDKSKKDGKNVTISVSQFPALAAGCLLYLTSPGLVCRATKQGKLGEETKRFLDRITIVEEQHGHQHIDVYGLNVLIEELHGYYMPLNTKNYQRCVTASDIMTEINEPSPEQRQEAGVVLGRVLYQVLLGRCIANHSLPEKSFFLGSILSHLGSENFTLTDLKALMKSLNLGIHPENGHQHDEHTDHDHRMLRLRKRNRHAEHEGNNTWAQHCFSAEELVQIHGLTDNSSVYSGLGRTGLAELSPALVQQILNGACTNHTDPAVSDGLSTTERYLYATLANVVITLTALFGIVVLLCTACTSVFQLSIQFCVSMAVGSLTGDALLHLLPMFLGLHLHTDDTSGHNHSSNEHEEGTQDYVYKMLVVIGGIYCFYLLETVFALITHKHNDEHHHEEQSDPNHCDHGKVLEMYQRKKKQKATSQSTTELASYEDEKSQPETQEHTQVENILPYMITAGDGIHNFADGLAMGAAFSLSWKSGLATSIAVLCHELPHELGDFAILLYSGVSVRRALLLNLGSAMTSFVGLYIALAVATDLATQQWIAAFIAGLFLYVGLADMLPTLVHISFKRPWVMFLLQNAGLLTGWSILLLLSIYEERISF